MWGDEDIFTQKAEPPADKHEKLKANEHAVFLTGVVLISATDGSRDNMKHVQCTAKYSDELILTEDF